jgi:tetratricopeptide (TPR) repeat protein
VDAITHLGVILALAGHRAEALEAFDRALAIDPDYAHALWDKAGVQEVLQDDAGVIRTLEHFVRVAPAGADKDRAQERIRQAKTRLAAAPKTSTPAPPAAGAAPAMRPGTRSPSSAPRPSSPPCWSPWPARSPAPARAGQGRPDGSAPRAAPPPPSSSW